MLKKTVLKRGTSYLKKGVSTLKKTSLRKIAIKSKEHAQNVENSRIQEIRHQNEFFMYIWDSLPLDKKRDYETGERIYNPFTVNFHHILPKALYPQFAYCKWNIVLVTWKTHSQLHTYPEKCPKIHKLYLELLSKVDTLDTSNIHYLKNQTNYYGIRGSI